MSCIILSVFNSYAIVAEMGLTPFTARNCVVGAADTVGPAYPRLPEFEPRLNREGGRLLLSGVKYVIP